MTLKYTQGHRNGAITYPVRYISLPVSGFNCYNIYIQHRFRDTTHEVYVTACDLDNKA